MNTETIFTVKNEHLNRLNQKTAVAFFQKLLWAEARRLGVEISKINVSSWVNVPDGGIDANVDDAQIEAGQGLIKQGKTSYQIKAGATFKPWQESVIKQEFFGTNPPSKDNLGESIKTCLDADGTYILVCTGINPTELQRERIYLHIKNHFKKCGYSNPKVDVFTQSNLKGFLELFPSLALWVNENDHGFFQTHQSWSEDGSMQVPYFPSQAQNEMIPKIQSELRVNNRTCHVRVIGEPGIGKTKLVLEATRTEDLAPLVIKCTADEFLTNRFLLNHILRDDNHFSIILVIDECDPNDRFYIWDKLQHRGPRIKLISIYNNHDPVAGRDISQHEMEHLEDDQIHTIIQGYGISKKTANQYLQFCGGSPRMAHHTGNILANYPGEPSQLLTDDYLFKSFYVDMRKEHSDSVEVQQRELVLRYIALFKQFGFGGSLVVEAKAIAKKVEEANPLITWGRFQEIIDNLKNRKILQGGNTYYITPIALQIKLWVDWWQIYGNPFDYKTFTEDFPPKLIEWFQEMFNYITESEPALKIVEGHLGPNGPFQNIEYLNTRLGSSFFLTLTEAAPKSALKCLMQTIGNRDKESLSDFTEGRRNVVLALEKIAMHRDLFVDAAKLLLALGEAENEGYSNNASGVFIGLFSPGPGRVAPTEASPGERLPILKEAFESDSEERRSLALKACNAALQSEHFSRIGGEYQGIRKRFKPWKPETYGELWDAYRQVWILISKQLEYLPEDERREAAGILLGRAGSLGRIPALGDTIVNTVEIIIRNQYAGKKQIIETISRILFYDDSYVENKGLPSEIRQHFEKIRDELVGSDFHSLMQRYVGMDILEDHPLEDGVDKIKPHLETLAKQSIDNPILLESELSWLVTDEAQNGNKFGYELGQRDESLSLLPMLLDAQRNAADNTSAYFLGGYFHAIFDRDLVQWEKQLDVLSKDITLNTIIPSLTHYSGLTDQSGYRILNLAQNGIIGISDFGLFVYKNAITCLSESVFHSWIEFLIKGVDRSAINIALKLFYNYYISQKPEPNLTEELTYRLLSHQAMFKESDNNQYDTMTDFYWTETAKVFLNLYPQKALELVKFMLVSFGNDKTLFDSFSQSCSFLTETTKKYPAEVWEYVNRYLDDRDNFSRTRSIGRWLREADISDTKKEKGAFNLFPREIIWEWVDENVENRAWDIASEFVPKTLLIGEWKNSLARDILIRYGDREDVRRTLISNYLTENFSGPCSLHYSKKLQKLQTIKNSDDNENVKQWINGFIDVLKDSIVRAEIEEERER